jgi:hypothetical protein
VVVAVLASAGNECDRRFTPQPLESVEELLGQELARVRAAAVEQDEERAPPPAAFGDDQRLFEIASDEAAVQLVALDRRATRALVAPAATGGQSRDDHDRDEHDAPHRRT